MPSSFPRRGVRNDRAFHRARGATWVNTWQPCAEAHGKQSSLGRSAYACVPHATVLSACNSQRHHALGALTECLASPHCWVLGPPTSSAGHRPFTTSRLRASRRAATRKARRRDGSVASRSAPVTMPARLLAGAGWPINIPGRAASQAHQEQIQTFVFWKSEMTSPQASCAEDLPGDASSWSAMAWLSRQTTNHHALARYPIELIRISVATLPSLARHMAFHVPPASSTMMSNVSSQNSGRRK